jgi:nucleotide-binding universal stress UspA family protein
MLTKILVPVRGDGMTGTVLQHAAAIARRHGAHVVVAHCRMRPEDLVPQSGLLPSFARSTMLEQARELADRQEDHLRGILHRLAAEFGLEEGAPRIGEAATCAFVEVPGKMPDVVTNHGRLADLIVLPKPQKERNLGQGSLRAALYSTGRPVMVCPSETRPEEGFGRHVAVGWNGSLPAARAVSSTLDLVAAAEEVTILVGNAEQPLGATTEELVDYYALRGVTARVRRFQARKAATGLLDETAAIGASLLVTGAYSHNQETEMLFGGNTQVIVDRTTLPVVMAH